VPVISVLKECCKSCQLCVPVCKQGVLAVGAETNAKGYNAVVPQEGKKCVGCRACVTICPEAALELEV
jgi:2-oxoglutarate ferredoxin oxidoreductase subunit delta